VLTFATPLDPSDEDWLRACQIVSGISSNKIDVEGLHIRALPCAAAGALVVAANFDVGNGEASEPNMESAAEATAPNPSPMAF
jgi:hypothetical protein